MFSESPTKIPVMLTPAGDHQEVHQCGLKCFPNVYTLKFHIKFQPLNQLCRKSCLSGAT